MLFARLFSLATVLAAAATSAAIPLPGAEGPQVLESLLNPEVSLSYKETHICETTPGVKSYSGYVNFPANSSEGRPYPIHTFFWFFSARKNPATAPLSLWLQGGPGSPSIPAALGENGPCYITRDSKSTTLNPNSWNNEVNMLYLDQPVQVGFSYDTLINGTVDEVNSPFLVIPDSPSSPPPKTNSTVFRGVFPSQNPLSTATRTETAAAAAWHFMQVFLREFPVYKPKDSKFSIWSESYGGHYGPGFADYFEQQNRKNIKGSLKLKLDTVGIVNGCVDIMEQMETYPAMAYENTYGMKLINKSEYETAMGSWSGCKERVGKCRALAGEKDPKGTGAVKEVNTACREAFKFCFDNMWKPASDKGINPFDITAKYIGSFPPKYAAGFLNNKEVQLDLGVPLNFSGYAVAVDQGFTATGDFVLGRGLAVLGELLDRGVKVALVYGDADYQCNWYGGEKISLAIESRISKAFRKAGYAEIHSDGKVGGYVRQVGDLSFSRVLDAGHEAPWYQPRLTLNIFNRVMFNKEVATGKKPSAGCSSTGPASVADIKNKVPTHPVSECYVWDIFQTCTPAQAQMLRNGTALTKDFIMVGYTSANGTAVYY